MSVCLSACINAAPNVWISVEFDIGDFIKSVDKLQIWAALNSRSLYMDTQVRCTVAGDIKSLLYNPLCFTLLAVTCNSPIHVINALLRFHWNNGYTNTPQCDILRTPPISLKVQCGLQRVKLQNREKETINLVNVRVRLVPVCVQIVNATFDVVKKE